MGRGDRQAGRDGTTEELRQRNAALNHALQRSIFAHLTRAVPDPDHPGRQITWDQLEQRLRGRAYRQAALAAQAVLPPPSDTTGG